MGRLGVLRLPDIVEVELMDGFEICHLLRASWIFGKIDR